MVQALGLDPSVAGLEAQVLLGHVLNQARAYLLAHPEAALTDANHTQFEALLTRRERGEPIAYLTGQREFYGLKFLVTPDVLIPRPETELLVELALEHIPHDTPMRILDLGTGSGAIAITLAKLRPQAQITAVDVSPQALAIARQNAARVGTPNIRFVGSNWFSGLDESSRFDLIVANPPYVAENDPHLSQGDVRYEPIMALTAGAEGLDAIRHIAQASLSFLQVGGRLLFEHGYDQEALSRDLLHSLGYEDIACYPDISGQPRVTDGKKP
ncbi:MAG: protein-(glutamine-N5) methyltransferase, release factor-specific [Betaproteobacteria bacterium RBG_16_58_11]|nr:MAG: protein-(glutamine-N5) methyltransferase, release factor-specific [Betaproteobacteria bacterium RBG_16_58_11]